MPRRPEKRAAATAKAQQRRNRSIMFRPLPPASA
jgi:hypothetical protein